MTAYLLRQAALLDLLKRQPSVPRYRSVLPGLWHLMGGREGTKRYLQLAWLAHRMEEHRDSSSVARHAEANATRFYGIAVDDPLVAALDRFEKATEHLRRPISIDDQLALVLDGLEREWRSIWR